VPPVKIVAESGAVGGAAAEYQPLLRSSHDQSRPSTAIATAIKQGVALTGRNTTGPPSRATPGELGCAAVEC